MEHLDEGCVGQVAEIFDGDAPHHPRGCPAQAWSVGEVLRVWRKVQPGAAKAKAAPKAKRATAKPAAKPKAKPKPKPKGKGKKRG